MKLRQFRIYLIISFNILFPICPINAATNNYYCKYNVIFQSTPPNNFIKNLNTYDNYKIANYLKQGQTNYAQLERITETGNGQILGKRCTTPYICHLAESAGNSFYYLQNQDTHEIWILIYLKTDNITYIIDKTYTEPANVAIEHGFDPCTIPFLLFDSLSSPYLMKSKLNTYSIPEYEAVPLMELGPHRIFPFKPVSQVKITPEEVDLNVYNSTHPETEYRLMDFNNSVSPHLADTVIHNSFRSEPIPPFSLAVPNEKWFRAFRWTAKFKSYTTQVDPKIFRPESWVHNMDIITDYRGPKPVTILYTPNFGSIDAQLPHRIPHSQPLLADMLGSLSVVVAVCGWLWYRKRTRLSQ